MLQNARNEDALKCQKWVGFGMTVAGFVWSRGMTKKALQVLKLDRHCLYHKQSMRAAGKYNRKYIYVFSDTTKPCVPGSLVTQAKVI